MRDVMIPIHIGSCISYWQDMPDHATRFGISATYSSKAGNAVSFSFDAEDVIKLFQERWWGYKMYASRHALNDYRILWNETAEDTAAHYMAESWLRWKTRNIQNLLDLYAAYVEPYDPLINNTMKEEIAEGTKESDREHKTEYGKETKSSTVTGMADPDVTSYTYGVGSGASGSPNQRTELSKGSFVQAADVDNDTVGVHSTGQTSWRDEGRVEHNNGDDTTTETPKNQQGLQGGLAGNSGGVSNVYQTAHEFWHTREGNLGEMTSQEMLKAELDLRKVDILAEFVRQFITDTCVFTNDDYFDFSLTNDDTDWDGL